MKVQKIDIDKLKPHPKNPRIHPDSAIEKLERSIKEFGWTNPILVTEENYVLAGHARLKAAKKAGLKEVPVIYLPLKGAKAEAYILADNRLQEETFFNDAELQSLIKDLSVEDIDLSITGFDEAELDYLLERTNFSPNLLPTLATDEIDDMDISKKENELESRFNNEYSYRTIVCPYCGEELTIDDK